MIQGMFSGFRIFIKAVHTPSVVCFSRKTYVAMVSMILSKDYNKTAKIVIFGTKKQAGTA